MSHDTRQVCSGRMRGGLVGECEYEVLSSIIRTYMKNPGEKASCKSAKGLAGRRKA